MSDTQTPDLLGHSQEYDQLCKDYATKMAALTAHTTNPPKCNAHILMRQFASWDHNPNKLPLHRLIEIHAQSTSTEMKQEYWKEHQELFDWRSKVTSLSNEANRAFEQLTLFLDPSRNPMSLFPPIAEKTSKRDAIPNSASL
jgi:hypothetical protein